MRRVAAIHRLLNLKFLVFNFELSVKSVAKIMKTKTYKKLFGASDKRIAAALAKIKQEIKNLRGGK